MRERRKEALRVRFDGGPTLAFHGSRITSDAGLLPYRELADALALTTMTDDLSEDHRTGTDRRHTLTAQLRQSIFSRVAGCQDTNDAERLRLCPPLVGFR